MLPLLLLAVAACASPITSRVTVRVFDGARRPLEGKQVLLRLLDGERKQLYAGDFRAPALELTGIPFHDNAGDDHTVLVSGPGLRESGFFPVKLSPAKPQTVELMLLPKKYRLDFSEAAWQRLPGPRERYEALAAKDPLAAASLLNIAEALSRIPLKRGPALSYLRRVDFKADPPERDRFFAYVPDSLLEDVRAGAKEGRFERIYGPGIFHPGAFESYKQVEFGEANVQFTFHPGRRETLLGESCMLLEADIDYYRDPLAHLLLEVIPGELAGKKTNPLTVYQLRWIAARRAGQDYDPGYTVVPAP